MAGLDYVARMDLIAERFGGFRYPWVSKLGAEDGEAAYTRLVEAHLSPDAVLLEAGCGHGPDMVRFAPRVARYFGYDLGPRFIETARAAAPANAELILANSSPGANGGQARIPMPDQSVDLIVSRRGPTNWIADARRVARPGAWLIQINPQPPRAQPWEAELPEDLRSENFGHVDMGALIRDLLTAADLRPHSQWTFDVPEYFADAEQLYAHLAWNRLFGAGDDCRPMAAVRQELEAVMAVHAGPDGLEVRRKRYLWIARAE